MVESAEGTDATVRSGPLPITSGSIRSFAEDPIRSMRSLHAEHGAYAALDDVGSRVRVSYTHELLGKEFEGQIGKHGFGAVSISFNYVPRQSN